MISNSILQSVPLLIDFPQRRFSVDYDHEADILYIGFQRPQKATDSEMILAVGRLNHIRCLWMPITTKRKQVVSFGM